ncbi:MAG: AbrB/MazE/SpoVT family DNA-binding domain-containing protein [bacterium]
MTIIEMAKVTSKGQVTIPNRVRKLLNLDMGSSVAFGLTKKGVVLLRCKVTTEAPYTAEEWEKIEKLAAKKGKVYKSAKEAMKHIETL